MPVKKRDFITSHCRYDFHGPFSFRELLKRGYGFNICIRHGAATRLEELSEYFITRVINSKCCSCVFRLLLRN